VKINDHIKPTYLLELTAAENIKSVLQLLINVSFVIFDIRAF